MPKLWVLRGIKKGILTSRYPKNKPTLDEIPRSSMPPIPTIESDWKKGTEVCPTGAIETQEGGGKINIGKCVFCRRCSEAGFEFPDGGAQAMRATFEYQGDEKTSHEEVMKRYAPQWKAFRKSFHILMIDVGSCNACNLEVLNLSSPYYDLNRLGIFFTNSPKQADALIVVGALNKAMVDVLKRTYESIPNPKLVLAVGACPISGGIFQGTEGFVSPVKNVIPVDVVIPGCPPTPVQILQGLLIAMGKIEQEETIV